MAKSTDEFIKENVPRGTSPSNSSEVPQLDAEGRLIDENAEMRSESQRMLNRLKTLQRENYRFGRLPPGIQRAVTDVMSEEKPPLIRGKAIQVAGDVVGGAVGASPTTPGSEAFRTGQAIANMPPVQAAAAIPAKIAASVGDAATALAAMGPAVGAVMKPKGGNWLAPSVERGLKSFKTTVAGMEPAERIPMLDNLIREQEVAGAVTPEFLNRMRRERDRLTKDNAINNWIDTKLTKYVKNEMATPEDPVRALAERGILHVDPEQLNSYPGAGNPRNQAVQRRYLGYPEEGLGRSEAAKRWEMASDYMIQTDRAQDLLDPGNYGQGFVDKTVADNPWLTKVDPYERIYGVDTLNYRPDYGELGFDHLIDELRNSLNPNSGLPRELQLTPKQLDKVSMPQAVELVDKINKWRYKQKAAADFKRSQNAATAEFKTYDTIPGTAEPNKRGLRWVELKPATMSEDFVAPDRYSIVRPTPSAETLAIQDNQTGRYITTGLKSEEQARKHLFDTLNRQQLEDALKYEGEVMGHCVGGYCPDVEEGRSRIYSLRDAKGEPHVTIEVKPNPGLIRHNEIIDELKRTGFDLNSPNVNSWDDSEYEAAYNAAQKALESRRPSSIVQIKGKANRAPKDEYLPFVQDFVRSGNWSNVQDLKNAGLSKVGNKYLTTKEYEALVEPAMRYLEQSPALEAHRRAQRELDAFGGDIPSPEYRELERRAGMQVHPDIPYTYREMTGIFRDPEAYVPESFGENIERVNRLRQLYGEEGFARGGPVNVSRGTSTSRKQLDTLTQVRQRKKA